jgi:deoxyribodipyrimidine photo-lyase
MSTVPAIRIEAANAHEVRPDADFVLYWMVAQRRVRWNFALQRAVEWARQLQKPLLLLEALRSDYPWASARLHTFVLQGMAENARRLAGKRVRYFPYVEPRPGAGRGLLQALAKNACVVVTDDFPCFFLPRMIARAASQVRVRLERVDSNGLLPLRAADREFTTAYSFRRFLQKELPHHWTDSPRADPLARVRLAALRALPAAVEKRWKPASDGLLRAEARSLAALPLAHDVAPVALAGGSAKGEAALRRFLKSRLGGYAEHRNEPRLEVTSGLSPYLHFGHVSTHQVFHDLVRSEGWFPGECGRPDGRREGWWGMSPSAEAFLDQLVTWRELGFAFCSRRPDYTSFASLPEWARITLAEHAHDPRPHRYSRRDFESARTHDPLWNAAQTQLLRQGCIHNYLRMLWGKKILEWSPTPRKALATMVELNNKYALDGRDPNSYSGIFWCLGRFDRPWPERNVYGKIRSMSSKNTARKFSVAGYIAKFGP